MERSALLWLEEQRGSIDDGGPAMKPSSTKPVRCAIYTRVSTDHGLDQEFNSLDAQYDAASAYIKSQAHAGWTLIRSRYNDGGYSGGSTDRPDLQKLLDDIRARKIDVIVVYKVDRLTRSLADFAKLVELFDAHGVSFVSVTQQCNTTASMGRLTLNVLLSFAQFDGIRRRFLSFRVFKIRAARAAQNRPDRRHRCPCHARIHGAANLRRRSGLPYGSGWRGGVSGRRPASCRAGQPRPRYASSLPPWSPWCRRVRAGVLPDRPASAGPANPAAHSSAHWRDRSAILQDPALRSRPAATASPDRA